MKGCREKRWTAKRCGEWMKRYKREQARRSAVRRGTRERAGGAGGAVRAVRAGGGEGWVGLGKTERSKWRR